MVNNAGNIMDERRLEKTKYNGFLIYIKYDGSKYYSFDENKDKFTVKGYIKNLLKTNKIRIYKGIQQAGRTDRLVSADINILYIMTDKSNIDCLLKYEDILKIEKTIAFLDLPNMIDYRKYEFNYPNPKNSEKIIKDKCKKLSGIKDYSNFTTKKGKLFKDTTRELLIEYIGDKLMFKSNAFLPHQIRIMSSYILNNSRVELSGKYLTLTEIGLSQNLLDLILKREYIRSDDIEFIEYCKNYTFIYTKDKSKLIGKNGRNIKKLGFDNKVIVRDI